MSVLFWRCSIEAQAQFPPNFKMSPGEILSLLCSISCGCCSFTPAGGGGGGGDRLWLLLVLPATGIHERKVLGGWLEAGGKEGVAPSLVHLSHTFAQGGETKESKRGQANSTLCVLCILLWDPP